MRTHRLVMALALAIGSGPTLAQEAVTPEAGTDDESQVLDELVVTGTRRTDRTVGESMSAIDVLSADELENAGTPELQAILTRTVPSFNFPRTSITDASDHVRPAQLRGLAPDQTLVLINGKRRHRTAIINVNGTVGRGSSPVDLNAIPLAAIERIEVLRDGASAQYGSDAIAGVINIVLRGEDTGGGAVDARYGEYSEGDGQLFQLSARNGFAVGEGGGFLELSAEWRDKDATNRSEADRRQQYPLVNGQRDPRENTIDRINHRFGDAATEDALLFANFALPVAEAMEIYAFAGASDREGDSAGFFRRALDARNVLAIYPDGFLPLIQSDVSDRSLAAGIRGDTDSGWQWDLSFNGGGSQFDFTIANSLNTSIGATSPTVFDAGGLEASQYQFNLDLNRGFDLRWLDSPLNLAAGVEYRRDRFEINEGEPASYFGTGSQVFPGFRPSDAGAHSRHNSAVYLDLEADPSEQLTLGAAVRYEDYSDFGSQSSGKLSGRFAFSDTFALRATASSGFRAPNLQQQFYSTTATNFINNQPFDIRTFAVTDPVAIALGAEPLQAEESTSVSLGLVAEPIEDLSITLDFYRIDVDDRINLSENLTGVPVRNFLAARGFPGTDGGRYFTNAIDTRTEGFDFITRYNFDLGDNGVLTSTLAYNYNDTDVTRIAANPAQLGSAGLNLQRIGRVERGRLEGGSPQDKLVLGGDYSIGEFTANLTATRYGKYSLRNANPVLDEFFDAQWILDLAVSYTLFGNTKLTLGAENISDQYPPYLKQNLLVDGNGFVSSGPLDNSFAGILPYARGEAPFGFNGRFVYGKVGFVW